MFGRVARGYLQTGHILSYIPACYGGGGVLPRACLRDYNGELEESDFVGKAPFVYLFSYKPAIMRKSRENDSSAHGATEVSTCKTDKAHSRVNTRTRTAYVDSSSQHCIRQDGHGRGDAG